MYTSALCRPFSQLALLAQQMHTSGQPLGWAVQMASVRMSSSLSRSGPGGKAIPGKFNFGLGVGEGDSYSGDGVFELYRSLFRTDVYSPW